MALVSLTVRREKQLNAGGRAKNYDSASYAVEATNIKLAVPSVCKKDNVADGLVNAKVYIEVGERLINLWTTQTVAEIAALT